MAEKLEKYLPNLQKKRLVEAEGQKFVYLGFVEGDYLDQNVNAERTGFVFPVNGEGGALLDQLALDTIRSAALGCVSSDLQPFLEEINTEKRSTIHNFISQDGPEYRPLARYMDEFIDRIPPGTSGRALESALHEQLYEKQRQLKQEGQVLFDDAAKQALKPEEYERSSETSSNAPTNSGTHRSRNMSRTVKSFWTFLRRVFNRIRRPGSTRWKRSFTKSSTPCGRRPSTFRTSSRTCGSLTKGSHTIGFSLPTCVWKLSTSWQTGPNRDRTS
jgi:hypothetical protein